jgi:negative regulator of flagellin synthesis FlgM
MIDGIRNNILFSSPKAPFTRDSNAADPAQPVRRVAQAGALKSAASASAGLVADLAKAPPVDAVRVAALKAAIDGGSYRIDPDAIAAAMLRLDRGRP